MRLQRKREDARAAALQRLNDALGQLRADLALVTAQTDLLASIEDERPLTPEERAEARRLKAEYRRLYWQLKALMKEFALTTHPVGRQSPL